MFYYILFKSLLTQPYFCRFHFDNYWNICIKNGFTPTLPTNWTPLRGWVPPMSMIPPNHKFFYGCRFLLLTFCQCISTHPAVHHKVWPESHKSSSYSSCYQEWDSGTSARDYHHLWSGKSMFALRTGFVNKNLQPFWFVEHPAIQEFITYLNHKLWDNDIPHKSSIASTVNAKVLQLEELTLAIVEIYSSCLNLCQSLPNNQKHIPLKVSTIWDGWSTHKRRPFTSFSISFVDSPLNNNTLWVLKKYLLEFNSPMGRHTSKLIGKDLINTIQKFWLERKVSTEGFVITNYF